MYLIRVRLGYMLDERLGRLRADCGARAMKVDQPDFILSAVGGQDDHVSGDQWRPAGEAGGTVVGLVDMCDAAIDGGVLGVM